MLPLRVVVAVGELLRVVADPERPRGGEAAGNAGRVARLARHHEHEVGAVEPPAQARDVLPDVAPGPGVERDGFRAVRFLGFQDYPGDLVEHLVPAHLLPPVLAAISAVALQGVQDAVRRVDDLGQVEAADAQAPLVEGVFRVSLHLDEPAVVVGVQKDPAPQVASRCRPAAPPGHVEPVFFVAIRLLVLDGGIVSFLCHHTPSPSVFPPACGFGRGGRPRRDVPDRSLRAHHPTAARGRKSGAGRREGFREVIYVCLPSSYHWYEEGRCS